MVARKATQTLYFRRPTTNERSEQPPRPTIGRGATSVRRCQEDGSRYPGIRLKAENVADVRAFKCASAQCFSGNGERGGPYGVTAIHAQHACNHTTQAMPNQHHARSSR